MYFMGSPSSVVAGIILRRDDDVRARPQFDREPKRISGWTRLQVAGRIAGERSIMLRLEGETLMPTGVVRSFNVKSGFGFIRPDDGSKDLFVHSGTVKRAGLKPLQEHQKISYDVRSEREGGRAAADWGAVGGEGFRAAPGPAPPADDMPRRYTSAPGLFKYLVLIASSAWKVSAPTVPVGL